MVRRGLVTIATGVNIGWPLLFWAQFTAIREFCSCLYLLNLWCFWW
jgi:hypothetical protein